MSARHVVRAATADDLVRFYGATPQRSTRAFVAIVDGEPLAVAGIAYQRNGAPPYFYSDMKPAMRPYRKWIVRGAQAMLDALGDRVAYAVADPLTSAPRLLSYLGFDLVGKQGNKLLFCWRPRARRAA